MKILMLILMTTSQFAFSDDCSERANMLADLKKNEVLLTEILQELPSDLAGLGNSKKDINSRVRWYKKLTSSADNQVKIIEKISYFSDTFLCEISRSNLLQQVEVNQSLGRQALALIPMGEDESNTLLCDKLVDSVWKVNFAFTYGGVDLRELDQELHPEKIFMIETLEKNPLIVNCQDSADRTLLTEALNYSNRGVMYRLAHYLLDKGADPNLTGEYCLSPLHFIYKAIKKTNNRYVPDRFYPGTIPKLIERLISLGADENAVSCHGISVQSLKN